jgi:CheY-like chemotaxis protein
MSYRLSALAEQDLEAIWSYVAEDASPTTADRLIDAAMLLRRKRSVQLAFVWFEAVQLQASASRRTPWTFVGDGKRAVYQTAITEYDAVILDVVLPLQDGLSVCRAIRGPGRRVRPASRPATTTDGCLAAAARSASSTVVHRPDAAI